MWQGKRGAKGLLVPGLEGALGGEREGQASSAALVPLRQARSAVSERNGSERMHDNHTSTVMHVVLTRALFPCFCFLFSKFSDGFRIVTNFTFR